MCLNLLRMRQCHIGGSRRDFRLYKPYRDIVDASFQCSKGLEEYQTGLLVLILQNKNKFFRSRSAFMMIGAAFIGFAGYALGCKTRESRK